jgi:2-dehydro-3-deoxyphosphogluconate aldolase/(4S)-4-hydroxy-2-oxoglutarate aldolase
MPRSPALLLAACLCAWQVRGVWAWQPVTTWPGCARVRQRGTSAAVGLAPVMRLRAAGNGPEADTARRQRVMLRVRIKIMEDVVRRVNDPALEYHRKSETVQELEGYLRRIRQASDKLSAGQAEAEASCADFSQLAPRGALVEKPRDVQLALQQDAQIEHTLARMREARVVAVLRGRSAQRLVARGLELADCGCRCIEVTLDSTDALGVLRSLRAQLPRTVLLGAATVMTAEQARDAISAGAAFVTSPVAAHELIAVCHPVGVLAIPAAFTPTEIYGCIAAGARAVKAFPASVLSPEGLAAILQLGPFTNTFVMAAGGLIPRDVEAWLDAGAHAVALGARLVGSDAKLSGAPPVPGSGEEQRNESEREWEERGRAEACSLFDTLARRA